jgi:hypothetical protein
VPAMISTPAPAMDQSAQWCGVRRSENKWEKTALSVHGSATMRSCASAARVEGTVKSSRECVMAFIKRHRLAVFFVLAYLR